MEYPEKFVAFEEYCVSCEFLDHNDAEEPCHECLSHPTNTHSIQPINYKKAEQKKDDKNKK